MIFILILWIISSLPIVMKLRFVFFSTDEHDNVTDKLLFAVPKYVD
jgi:hypothetical protein